MATLLAALVLAPSSALAWSPPGQPPPASAPPGNASLVPSMNKVPAGYHMLPSKVLAVASKNPQVVAEVHKQETQEHVHLTPYVYTRSAGVWQVSWFNLKGLPGHPNLEMIQAYVNDDTGQVTQAWTGYQVAWTMARGYPGAFGHHVDALWIWLPMCAFFLLPFLPWRRRPTLLHLDLLVLIGMSVSLAFFNHGNLGMSVPTIYPFMLYVMVRLALMAFGIGRPRKPLRILIPTPWLALLLVFLLGFRIMLNVTDSNVIDVGYAGTIGASKILHGQQLYGHWPSDNPAGDTYGPFNYLAYIPGTLAFPWHGTWDNLPSSDASAIGFDLLTIAGLFWLGRRVRGPDFGVVLAYLWAAFPFTLFALESNSNDSLVALMTVVALLTLTSKPARTLARGLALPGRGGPAPPVPSGPVPAEPGVAQGMAAPPWVAPGMPAPSAAAAGTYGPSAVAPGTSAASAQLPDPADPRPTKRSPAPWARFRRRSDLVLTSAFARGVAGGLAGLTKFAPFVLAPLLLRGTADWRRTSVPKFLSDSGAYLVGYVLAVLVPLLLVLLNHDLKYFVNDAVMYQAKRPAPFSIWGLWGNTFGGVPPKLPVAILRYAWMGITVLGALVFMIWPLGKREVWQVAALGAAGVIAVECCTMYWFYLYIPWFFAMTVAALVLAFPGDVVESDLGGIRAGATAPESVSSAPPTPAQAPAPA